MLRNDEPVIAGWLERVVLVFMTPDGKRKKFTLKAKIDTGAESSALHATRIAILKEEGVRIVSFEVSDGKHSSAVRAKAVDKVKVKSSNGKLEKRWKVRAYIRIGHKKEKISLSLTNRDRMEYPMLIGRDFLSKRFLVDSSHKYLLRKPARTLEDVSDP